MKNILENKFWWAAKSFATIVVGVSFAIADVFITELTDPQNSSDAGRYVELYNSGSTEIDLGTGWALQRWTNGNTDPQSPVSLTGYIPAGGFFIVCTDNDKFSSTYGFEADQDIGTGGAADSNGDDNIALVDASGNIIDMFGVAGEDGTGTAHEFEDGRAERIATVTSGNPTWDAAEWNIDNDSGGGDGPQYAPEDFDPRAWIGHEGEPPSIVGTWKLAPLAGALRIGDQGPGSSNWWQSNEGDVQTRACLFDDEYVFHADGSFENILGTETWLEPWQGVDPEACGAPIAPHNGSNAATYAHDTSGTITLSGVGAFLGLAKAINGGELGAESTAPDARTYTIMELDADQMLICIGVNEQNNNIYWTFHMVNDQWEPEYEDINITFNVDMSGAESINTEGISIAGGSSFGSPGENQMTDANGDGIYTITLTRAANSSSHYTFLNGISEWGQKEQIAGQECADPSNYNDRFLEWGVDDVVVNACFGICGDGTCAELTPPPTVLVHFNVYFPGDVDTVWATGSFEGWSGYGVPMTDPDGNGIYTGVHEMVENAGDVEYKYTLGGWDGVNETGANSGDWCDWNPDDTWNNFGFSVENYDVYLPVFMWGMGCEQWQSPLAGRPWTVEWLGVGPSPGSGEWWSADPQNNGDRWCHFDDRYFFHWNGDFHIDFGGDTWIEVWQGADPDDGCSAPVAPHDNSNYASHSYDINPDTISTMTLHGVGAFLGLPKAVNGAELSNPADAPGSVTYNVAIGFNENGEIDTLWVSIDVSSDESVWWNYTMVREPAPTMVTFWLDAQDVPCDGSPYLAGSFNGWNADDIEMMYDEYWNEYYADVWLMPGSYEYKFTCSGWTNSEDIPAECSDPNDDGYNNRYIEVPALGPDDYYETDVVAWGECPPPDPCEVVDCSNLHFAGVMESMLVEYIADTLDLTADSVMLMVGSGDVMMGVYSTWGTDTATFIPEFSSVEDTSLLYLVEYPFGFPDYTEYYYWWWRVPAYDLDGFEFGDLQDFGPGEECTALYPPDSSSQFNVRYWDPSDWEEELLMIAVGDDDIEPYDVWNVDLYGSCDYWFDDGDGPDDNMVYLGNYNGHDYYAVEEEMDWWGANDNAWSMGGYLATINTPGENWFLLNSLNENYLDIYRWIGLHDYNMDGTGWGWVTGEPLGYSNWSEGEPSTYNGTMIEACAEFFGEWNDTDCDGSMRSIVELGSTQPPSDPVQTNYVAELINSNAHYYHGDSVGSLPDLEIDDGLHLTVVFDTTGAGPYMGLAVIHFDSNFNGVLDTNDRNLLDSEWYYDNYGNNTNGDEVFVILDNGPADLNFEIGVFESDMWANDAGNEFLRVQGATYFFSSIDTNNAIVQTVAVAPSHLLPTSRVTGESVMADDTTATVPGLFFTVAGSLGDQWVEYYGVSGADGKYDIGVEFDSYAYIWQSWQQNNNWDGRHLVLFWSDNYYYDYGGSWATYIYWADGVPSEGIDVPTQVVTMNTVVYGQVVDPNGNPVETGVNTETNIGTEYNPIYAYNYSYSDSSGNYQSWSMNGSQIRISSEHGGFEYYDSTFVVFSEIYDEWVEAYMFNHNIEFEPLDPGPPVNLTRNGGFEDDYHMLHWNIYPDESSNYMVDSTGSYVYNSDQTIEAYEGDHVLKMWGGYHSDGFNVTDIYQQYTEGIDTWIEGGSITASAMMMSHPDDWIGDTSNGAATNRANVFISFWDYDWNMIHIDVSEPLDGADEPGVWHYKEVTADIPYGAYAVNIGVSLVQNDWSNGSVYFDDVQSSIGMAYVFTGNVEGYVYGEMYNDEFDYWYFGPLANVPVDVYNDVNHFVGHTDEYGYYNIEVPGEQYYYVSGPSDLPGLFGDDLNYTYVGSYSTSWGGEFYYNAYANQWYVVEGHVVDADGNPMGNVHLEIFSADTNNAHNQDYYTYDDGHYWFDVPHGIYNIKASLPGHHNVWINGVEVFDYITLDDITLEMITEFDGSVQGVITFIGQEPPSGTAWIQLVSDNYSIWVGANEDGFYYADLLNGIYSIGAGAPGYSWTYMEDVFEVSSNAVTFNMDLYEEGFAVPPEITNLYDVPNDQGRQMRAVWHAGMPGEWEYFTQFSIWRKVNGAMIDLWDYVETVPWHGMDPYAAVVPTLGDSSMHEQHLSTFIVTAHTEDVDYWVDSEPVSGYSVDNLHPSVPMNFVMSYGDGAVSLSWTGADEEDFSHHNVYRREIISDEPAVVFTTVDSFYVDQDISESGAYEYWITAVDMSGLESDPSNSVSAVLSTDDKLGIPSEFALKQNYPNPFNPSTQIQYALPEETRVVISIYDLMGRKVRTLVNDVQNAGYKTVMWNATNDMGRLVSAGVYIYSIQAGDFIQNRKMVLMK